MKDTKNNHIETQCNSYIENLIDWIEEKLYLKLTNKRTHTFKMIKNVNSLQTIS